MALPRLRVCVLAGHADACARTGQTSPDAALVNNAGISGPHSDVGDRPPEGSRRDRQHGLDLRDRGLHRPPKELIQQGIRVNAIAPGFVDTQLVSGSLTEPLIGAVTMGTPQGRLGRPDEIAAAIAFLCSDDASFFVGETISPNGGFVTV